MVCGQCPPYKILLDRIYPAGRNQGLIDFKIVCRLPTQVQVNLGVCVLTSSDFETIRDACNRLLVYKDFGLDRLCLLRHGDLRGCLKSFICAIVGDESP
jgi:hypothetical protein